MIQFIEMVVDRLRLFFHLTPPTYNGKQKQHYLDGFATGYPLQGQPAYPVHNTMPYYRGLRYGRRASRQFGQPQITYELYDADRE